MSKAFLGRHFRELGFTCQQSRTLANDLIDTIAGELKKSGYFCLTGFGTFNVTSLKARNGMNPKTGEKIRVKARKSVRFRASRTLCDGLKKR